MTDPTAQPPRPATSLLALLVIPLFVGLLAAPLVYNFIRAVGLYSCLPVTHPDLAGVLREVQLERVANRCVMLTALVLLVPMFRRAGLGPRLWSALRLTEGRARTLASSYAVGMVSMAVLYGVGWGLGAFTLEPALPARAELALSMLSFLLGATFIGFFEESFFRGFVFGAIRIRLAFWSAAVVASVFFSGLHFVQPVYMEPVRWAAWSQGFDLLPHAFGEFSAEKDWPFVFTLFVMGLTLCLLYERQGHLLSVVGLHGGWVLAMQCGSLFFDRQREVLTWWFGHSDFVAKGFVAAPVMVGFFIWSLARHPARCPHELPRTGGIK